MRIFGKNTARWPCAYEIHKRVSMKYRPAYQMHKRVSQKREDSLVKKGGGAGVLRHSNTLPTGENTISPYFWMSGAGQQDLIDVISFSNITPHPLQFPTTPRTWTYYHCRALGNETAE